MLITYFFSKYISTGYTATNITTRLETLEKNIKEVQLKRKKEIQKLSKSLQASRKEIQELNLQPKRDSSELKGHGIEINGVYKVHQNHLKIIQVYCD